MDRWALAELDAVVTDVTDALEQFDAQRAGQRLSAFVDDLSNWYVRRSRRRFWAGDPAALATLHTCLETLTRLLAPITPFITERVWQDVVRPVTTGAAESVHLASLADGRARRRRRPSGPTPTCRGRWRWSGGWSSSAGRRARSPGSAPASRCAGRW